MNSNTDVVVTFSEINECMSTPSICGAHGTCGNNQGSYTCTCDDGWMLDEIENLYCIGMYTMNIYSLVLF